MLKLKLESGYLVFLNLIESYFIIEWKKFKKDYSLLM